MSATAQHPPQREGVFEQFETLEQQQDSYVIGMWTFLVTEIMFFGSLFIAYVVYRWQYQPAFYELHTQLDVVKGTINTVILLASSLTMALAVHYAQRKNKAMQLKMLGATVACALGFMVVKFLEYASKVDQNLFPGPAFRMENPEIPANVGQLFFSLYFAMTGLHGIHVVAGIIAIGALAWLVFRDSVLVKDDYIPTEMVGLYWHFVDLVWIFLFPLFYLLPR